MTQYVPIIVVSALLAFLSTPATRWLARRLGMVDQPGLRKAHRSPVPLLGGVAMFAAVTLAFVLFGERDWVREGVGILGGATLMFLTGFWDDRYGMPARFKLLACGVAALFLSAFGVRVQLLNIPWVDTLVTVVWIVGITNAANLMDNMDGLAAGLTAVGAAFFFVMAALEGQGLVASLAAALLGSAVGFLFYNLAPAISFMGDAGSLTLGFLLAALGIKLRFLQLPLASTWMAPIVVLGVFIFDTTLVTISRLRRGRSPLQGGSDHTSHRLVQLGLSQPRAVLTLYVGAVLLGASGIMLTRLEPLAANLSFAALLLAGFVALWIFERVEPKLAGDPPLVLVPGGGGVTAALQAVHGTSRSLTVLLAAAGPARADVIAALTALAEEPAVVERLLERGLGERWWEELPALQRALRLTGVVLAIGGPAGDDAEAEALTAIKKARLILLGPGRLEEDVRPLLGNPAMNAALRAANVQCLWLGERPALIGEPLPIATTPQAEIQRRLLQQAAGQVKTHAVQ